MRETIEKYKSSEIKFTSDVLNTSIKCHTTLIFVRKSFVIECVIIYQNVMMHNKFKIPSCMSEIHNALDKLEKWML